MSKKPAAPFDASRWMRTAEGERFETSDVLGQTCADKAHRLTDNRPIDDKLQVDSDSVSNEIIDKNSILRSAHKKCPFWRHR